MTESPNLNDEFSYLGFFWLPELPDMKWAGRITYKPETGISLDLYNDKDFEFKYQGNRGVIEHSHPSPPDYKKKFLGEVLQSARYVSLLGNHRISEDTGNNVFFKHYRPEYLLIGRDLCSPEDINLNSNLNSAIVTYSSLRGWMWLGSPFNRKIEGRDITLSYTLGRKLLEFDIPAIESKLLFYEGIKDSPGGSGHEITRHSSIEIEPDSPQTLGWFCEQIDSIRDLIAFLAGVPVESKRIRVGLDEEVSKTGYVDVYRHVRSVKMDEDFNNKMTFPFTSLMDLVPAVFQAWFAQTEEDRVPYNLCRDVIFSKDPYSKFEFLALVHALESHHRNLYRENRRKEQDKTVKQDKREPSLLERLKELRSKVPKDLLNNPGLSDDFLRSVRDTRHYFSHYNPEDREKALVGNDFYEAINRLIMFVAAVLYRKLSIPDETILEVFRRADFSGLWQRSFPMPPGF